MKRKLRYLGLVLAGLIMLTVGSYFAVLSPVQAYSGAELYTARAGDSLFIIAGKYGISVMSLKQANGLQSDMITVGQVLTIPLNISTNQSTQENNVESLKDILNERGITYPWLSLKIIVNKSAHTLSVVYKNTWLKTYHVELGAGGLGDKEVLGDLKTPEGTFYISQKTVISPADQYLGTRWMRLSYPNAEDAERGVSQGLIKAQTRNDIVTAFNAGKNTPQYTALGGGVGIHGGDAPELGSDWTWGCIGLTNSDVEDFYDFVSVGTPIIITK